jgi:hypothetical protein
MTTQVKPFSQAWAEFSEEINALAQRCDRVNKKARERAIRDLRKLYPSLPVEGCLHLAHNWLVCGNDKHMARKAKFIIGRYHAVVNKLYHIQKDWYLRRHDEVMKPYRNS